MLLTLTLTAPQASDLGFLLHKHPERVQSFEVSVGTVHVCYPEATAARCSVAVLLEVDPIGLVRDRRWGTDGFALAQYVNDRPYAASSMLAVALGQVFRTALRGECRSHPELARTPLPLTVHLPSVPSRGGADLVERLFVPLGWAVSAVPRPLDPQFPEWGDSRHLDVTLTGASTVADALTQLYVLLPVLDGTKHYWVGPDEVDKLVRRGGTWLAAHPERDIVLRRYLAHRRAYVADATERLAALEDSLAPTESAADPATPEVTEGADGVAPAEVTEADEPSDDPPQAQPVRLQEHRIDAVLQALRDVGASRVVDLGCGQGALLRRLLADAAYRQIVGVEVSPAALQITQRRLHVERMSQRQAERLTLLQGSATYRDDRIAGYDAVVLMEVLEHVDPDRLPDLARCVFGHAHPAAVVVTTPNVEYNVRYETLPAGTLRHRDHRFEWSRSEFRSWAEGVATTFGYAVQFRPVGDDDPQVGPPTQLALFTRAAGAP